MKASVSGFTTSVRLNRYLAGADMVILTENEFPLSWVDPPLMTIAVLKDLQRPAKSLTCFDDMHTVSAEATKVLVFVY